MNNQRNHHSYIIPPPSARIVAIATKWAKQARTVEHFNLFSDLSRCDDGATQFLGNDVTLATARQAALENALSEDDHLAQEAREIIAWADSAQKAPRWVPPPDVMTIDQWVKE